MTIEYGGRMALDDQSASFERIRCEVCHIDIPLSEAVVAEATDYVVYFCGLDCYDRWRHQSEALLSDPPATSQR
jgi:hypothetical protein